MVSVCSSLKEGFGKIGEISRICDNVPSAGVPTYHLGELGPEHMMSGLDLDSQAEGQETVEISQCGIHGLIPGASQDAQNLPSASPLPSSPFPHLCRLASSDAPWEFR